MRRLRRPLLAIFATALLTTPLAGCRAMRSVAAKYPRPDIEAVYRPAMRIAESTSDRNPLVVIPGFGGSELQNGSNRVIWGARFTNDAMSFARPEGLRALALGVPENFASLTENERVAALFELEDDDTVVSGAMHFYRTEVMTEVSVSVYAGLVRGLAAGGYRVHPPELARRLGVPARPDGPPCFVFSFDWRRDLAGVAADFARFLDRTEAEVRDMRRQTGGPEAAAAPVRFDVLAHSMAGLMTRYYLRYGARDVLVDAADGVPPPTWEGARRVDRAVLVSPPNRGTTRSLRNLANGADDPFIPAYEPALVATWLSVPQLFPRNEPLLLSDDTGRHFELDPFDVEGWRTHRWGPYRPEQEDVIRQLFPGVPDPAERRRRLDAYFAASLERAERFTRVLDAPATPPNGTTLHLFAGDSESTLSRGLALRRDGALHLIFEAPGDRLEEPGDGSVTRRSALADLRPVGSKQWLRSSVSWHSVLFLSDRHTGFFTNRVFLDNLLHLLLETPPASASVSSQ